MTQILRTKIVPFRGRRLRPSAEAWVYRNLHRTGAWYSVAQNGLVIGHTQFMLLDDVRFVVHAAGAARALKTGVKNVHAFCVGKVSRTELFFNDDALLQLGHRSGYLPRLGFWVDYKSTFFDPFGDPYVVRMGITEARSALLSKDGLTVDEPTTHDLEAQ